MAKYNFIRSTRYLKIGQHVLLTRTINDGYTFNNSCFMKQDEIVEIIDIGDNNSCRVRSLKTGNTSAVYLRLSNGGGHLAFIFKNKRMAKLLYDKT